MVLSVTPCYVLLVKSEDFTKMQGATSQKKSRIALVKSEKVRKQRDEEERNAKYKRSKEMK